MIELEWGELFSVIIGSVFVGVVLACSVIIWLVDREAGDG